MIGDGHLGIWAATRNVFPEAEEQRCWNHRILNVLDRIPKRDQAQAKPLLTAIPYPTSLQECETKKAKFQDWCLRKGLPGAAHVLDEDWERMVSFYSFPKPHWQHLRTSNVVESPFAALRLRTDAAKRFKKIESATATIFKLLLVAEKNFRRLNAPELMREVHLGVRFEDGDRVTESSSERDARQGRCVHECGEQDLGCDHENRLGYEVLFQSCRHRRQSTLLHHLPPKQGLGGDGAKRHAPPERCSKKAYGNTEAGPSFARSTSPSMIIGPRSWLIEPT